MNKKIKIEKATPEQFFAGVERYKEFLEKEVKTLKEIIKQKEHDIKQLKTLLSHKGKYTQEVNNNNVD